jgi:hypothetical protein
MSELSSDSSDSSDNELTEKSEISQHELNLNMVNECIREYEKEQKKERKIRKDARSNIETVEVPADALQHITLTKMQLRQLAARDRKERTEKQKEQTRLLAEAARKKLDLRKDKEVPGVVVKVAPKAKPRGRHVAKPKVEKIEEVEEEEEEEEEAPPPPKTKGFQARKPKLEDEIEEKVQKLNKLDAMIAGNPYYAMIMAQRQKGRQ